VSERIKRGGTWRIFVFGGRGGIIFNSFVKWKGGNKERRNIYICEKKEVCIVYKLAEKGKEGEPFVHTNRLPKEGSEKNLRFSRELFRGRKGTGCVKKKRGGNRPPALRG